MSSTQGPSAATVEAACAAAERMLRGGGLCRINDPTGDRVVAAIDVVGAGAWPDWVSTVRDTRLVITGARARIVGVAIGGHGCAAVQLDSSATPALVDALVGRRGAAPLVSGLRVERATRAECAAVDLAKRAGLLPAVLSIPAAQVAPEGIVSVAADAVLEQPRHDLETLERTVEAKLPTVHTEAGRLVAFRSNAAALEHLALLIGHPEKAKAPLCRLHSECLTGDVFGSLRCDCGEQLDGAMARMAAEGDGVLLYLRQEGRGIGLVNKLRAYRLQEQGLDTVDANTHLGFQPDERDFATAARMLRLLGIRRVRLLTNNPEKIDVLTRHGIEVVERVAHSFAANHHNRSYLETKAQRSGHLLRAIEGGRIVAGGSF